MEKIDGKKVASDLQNEIAEKVAELREKHNEVPGLAVIIVGDDDASLVYVGSKERMAKKLGFRSELVALKKDVSEQDLIREIHKLNEDSGIHGILVQLPLPEGFDTWKILGQLDPKKDVDCFLPVNQGNIMLDMADVFPCTPFGIIKMLESYNIDVRGKSAVVLGRSFIVGKPVAAMLLNRDATVTVCHSKTQNIEEEIKKADIVVAAIGRPGFVKPDMVKAGAVLIDVGINRLTDESMVNELCTEKQIRKFAKKGYAITGDIHPKAFEKSSFYTPVPGGVGSMTVAMLMYSTLELFKKSIREKGN